MGEAPPVTIYNADSHEVLRLLADNSVDAVVCDPPYALVSIQKQFGKAGSAPPSSEGASGVYMRSAAGFMGQGWDTGETAFAVEFWAEVWRVLKPGGHVLAFSGSRTYHRLAVAIEDAGFEIRDMIADLISTDAYVEAFAESLNASQRSLFARMLHESPFGGILAWIYGSGFPKSHDLAKAVDKRRDDRGDWLAVGVWLRARREAAGLRQKDVAALWPSATGGLTGCVANWELGLGFPTWEQWGLLKIRIGFGDEMDAEVWRLNGRKGQPSDAYLAAEVIGEHEGSTPGLVGMRFDGDRSIRELSDLAASWAGWGTALKPALEPVCVGRKPLDGTLAENAVKWGVGGFNIDACRIGDGGDVVTFDREAGDRSRDQYRTGTVGAARPSEQGRWPANVIHDGSAEVVAGFPSEAGAFAPAMGTEPSNAVTHVYGARERVATQYRGDSGSAARFFYSAKADAIDRLGSAHPTVKPVDVMAWLIRLVCPPGGLVLDPFAGSGTTGVAAVREGRRAILIERDAEHADTCRRRVAWAQGQGGLTAQEALKPKHKKDPAALAGAGSPLFGGGDA